MVEYASADAVRRGQGVGHKLKKTSTESSSEGYARRKRRDLAADDGAGEKSGGAATTTNSKLQEEKGTAAGRRRGAYTKPKVDDHRTRKSRPAPGAALALAKREQVAIVPSQGRRITFSDD